MRYFYVLLGCISLSVHVWASGNSQFNTQKNSTEATQEELAYLREEVKVLKKVVEDLQERQERGPAVLRRKLGRKHQLRGGGTSGHGQIQGLNLEKKLKKNKVRGGHQGPEDRQSQHFSNYYGYQKEPVTLQQHKQIQANQSSNKQHIHVSTLDPIELIRREVSDLRAQEEHFLGAFADHMGLNFTKVAEQIQSKWEGDIYCIRIKLTSPRTQKFDIHLDGRELIVQQVNQEQHKEQSGGMVSSSSSISSSSQSVSLPRQVDKKSMKVHQQGGYLVITFEKII